MDFVYICRGGENEELRYSIRSVIANFATVGNVWIIGDKPDWYTGNFVYHVGLGRKYDNIREAIKVACLTEDISEDFVLMNDDFFIVRKLNSVSLYHGGLLFSRYLEHQERIGPNVYANLLGRTDQELKKLGVKEPLNYDLHVPMPINKTNMLQVVDQPWSIRSFYGNMFNVGGEQINDVKVYSDPRLKNKTGIDNGTPYVSTEDGSFGSLQVQLHQMFPNPSKYEHPRQDSNLRPKH